MFKKFFKFLKIYFISFNFLNYPRRILCPMCEKKFGYKKYSGMSQLFPHFYCNKCSNVIRRSGDFHQVMTRGVSEELLEEISRSLPACPCGGMFLAGRNPKCPYCEYEFPNLLSRVDRLTDPYLIVVAGAKTFIEH